MMSEAEMEWMARRLGLPMSKLEGAELTIPTWGAFLDTCSHNLQVRIRTWWMSP